MYWKTVAIAVLIALCAWALPRLDWVGLWQSLRAADAPLVVLYVFTVVITWLARSLLFWLIVRLRSSLTYPFSVSVSFIGGLMDQIIPGRSGLFVRWGLCSSKDPAQKSFFFSVILASFLMEAIALVLVFLITLLISPQVQAISHPSVNFALGVLVAAIFLGLLITPYIDRKTVKWKVRSFKPIAALFEMAHSMRRPQLLLLWLIVALLGWAIQVAGLLILSSAFSLSLDLFQVIVVLLAINLAIAIPIVPGNVGTMQLVIVAVLTQMKISSSTALAFSIVYHLGQFLPVLAVGSSLAFFFPVRRAQKLVDPSSF